MCPICEQERAPADGFLSLLSAPARRALENENINSLKELSRRTEKEVLALHGFGPSSLPPLREALEGAGLSFRNVS